jgi:NAD(P)-dependent dehydrogenase (short-subunit alcohol dehydrogenase family)
MKVIAGKKVLVTGAATGIGRATALAFADEGAELYLLDVKEESLNGLALLLRQRGASVVARSCDLTDRRALDDCLQDLLERWGGVDIVVNNAGVLFYGLTAEMSEEQWDCLVSVNLSAPCHIIRRLLPVLTNRGEAHIVNVCSLAGLAGFKRFAAYSLTKFGAAGI